MNADNEDFWLEEIKGYRGNTADLHEDTEDNSAEYIDMESDIEVDKGCFIPYGYFETGIEFDIYTNKEKV